jgi:hypothetical protein
MLICGPIQSQTADLLRRVPSPQKIRGGTLLSDGRLLTWGEGLHAWTVTGLQRRELAAGDFGEGGCLVDLDGDGAQEFVGKEGPGLGKLTWRTPPYKTPIVIDDESDTHDCLEATLFGRKGVLVIQRHMQVRFYERVAKSPWPYREIYSIYTPSQQTGLSLRDVDRDGRIDIICGNYWIQSPERFDLAWHIFAINAWFEEPLSATLAHASIGEDLFVAQAHMADARAAIFRRPSDPKLLWPEERINMPLHRVHVVAVINGMLFFAENNGSESRTFLMRDGMPEKILDGIDTLALVKAAGLVLSIGPREVALWRYRRK